ncbi:MAG: hypothetical protein J3K34DRAFT_8548 [Monoraphidium minutum]|nr:MAG: hypothetical protein J3K34DRAFT_8548 [Monoraphidium minutum]
MLRASQATTARPVCSVTCHAAPKPAAGRAAAASAAAALAASLLLSAAPPALAEFRLPPIDKNDPNRCDRGFVGNTIGQANAVSDKILDLRQCSYKGANLTAKVLAGALMSDADFSGANMQEAVLTKAYAVNANLSGADLTNAVVDRVDFTGADLSGAKFVNAVVTGATFEGANLANTNFEDALVGSQDAGKLCANKTLTGESRDQVGCRQN